MSVVDKINGLNGAILTRAQIRAYISQAKTQEQNHIAIKLQEILRSFPEKKSFELEIVAPQMEIVPESHLTCLDCEIGEDDANGLNKAVSPTEIYDMITDRIISALDQDLQFVQEWTSGHENGGYLVAYNFASKKPYRGINTFMLGSLYIYDQTKPLLENPYYLTFKQVEELGGKVRAGSKGEVCVYFTRLYKVELADRNLEFATYDFVKMGKFLKEKGINPQLMTVIPILKYYKVFNGKDIDGINFDLENFDGKGYIAPIEKTETLEKIPVAEAIIENYPTPSPKIGFGGSDAFYRPSQDLVQMPKLDQFKYVQAYYTTFFHELVHSTGSDKRLKREKGKKFGDKKYAFEELIAELGASFLSAEAGMLHYTFRNSAAYIKGWRGQLKKELKADNKFFFRAATKAQEAVDFMLDRDENGVAAYEKNFKPEAKPILTVIPEKKKKTTKKKSDPAKPKATVLPGSEKKPKTDISKPKATVSDKDKKDLENNPKGYANKPKSVAVATAIKDVLSLKKYNRVKEIQANMLYNLFKNSDNDTEIVKSEYQNAILTNESWFHDHWSDEVTLTELGREFINSVNGRLESLRNQKYNLALFDGLKMPVVDETNDPEIEEIVKVIKKEMPERKVVVFDGAPQKLGAGRTEDSEFFAVSGEVGKFLQQVEKKPFGSVVITIDGMQGAGKTTMLYQFMEAFDSAKNNCLFISGEEDPNSHLAKSKAEKFLSENHNVLAVGEVENVEQLYKYIENFEIIFIDSWQKLLRMVGNLRLDEDLRKKFHGKVFVIIFQQTTTGRTKGGAEVVFDGDIIIKMMKEQRFEDNYAFFDKNRYTLVPIETIRYNIASGSVYDPNPTVVQPEPPEEIKLNFKYQEY